MRVTADTDEQTYSHVRKRAQLENGSMNVLLGELVRMSLQAKPMQLVQSGRFRSIARPVDAPMVSAEAIQKIIDADGFL